MSKKITWSQVLDVNRVIDTQQCFSSVDAWMAAKKRPASKNPTCKCCWLDRISFFCVTQNVTKEGVLRPIFIGFACFTLCCFPRLQRREQEQCSAAQLWRDGRSGRRDVGVCRGEPASAWPGAEPCLSQRCPCPWEQAGRGWRG